MTKKANKELHMSRSELALCTSCMTHITIENHALDNHSCPFCGESLHFFNPSSSTKQRSTPRSLLRGKSGALFAALGVSISLLGCDSTSSQPRASSVEPLIKTAHKPGAAQSPSIHKSHKPSRSILQKTFQDLKRRIRNLTFEDPSTVIVMYGAPPVSMIPEDKEARRKEAELIIKQVKALQATQNAQKNEDHAHSTNDSASSPQTIQNDVHPSDD